MTAPRATARLGFKPAQKLRNAADFEQPRKAGRRIGDAFFGIQYVANDRGHARLGMAVGLRAVGTAVRRNRIRRIIRESFRVHQHELPAVDVVVNARSRCREARGADLSASLKTLWGQIRKP